MHTFAQKKRPAKQTKSARSTSRNHVFFAQSHPVNSIHQLQRTIGNQAVQRLLERNAEDLKGYSATSGSTRFGHDFSRVPSHNEVHHHTESKRSIGNPKALYEHETARVSDKAMDMPKQQFTGTRVCGGEQPRCQAAPIGNEHKSFQTSRGRANDPFVSTAPPIVQDALRSPSKPLDDATRAFMEPRFGRDFSQVQIHTGATAAASARAMDAQAFTIGSHVMFGTGNYDPDSLDGRRLIAHELAHALQQSFVRFDGVPGSLDPSGAHERAAADAVRNIDAGRPPGPIETTTVGIAKQQTTPASNGDPDVEDTMAGTLVSSIIIDLRSGRVGFVVPGPKGMILGNVSTDLKPGEYTVKPDPEKGRWVFRAKAGQRGVKPGQRFEVNLEGALPWTLAYPDEVPVFVGFSTKRKGGGPGHDPADLVRIFEEMAGLGDIPEDPTIDGFVDFEYVPTWIVKGDEGDYSTTVTLKYLAGTSDVFDLAAVGDGKASEEERKTAIEEGSETPSGRLMPKVLNRSTVPNLWDLKQRILWLHRLLRRAGEEELFREQLKTFPEVFTTVTLGTYFAMAPIKSPFRSPGWSSVAKETIKAQGSLRKGMLEALKQGGTRDVTVRGVAFRISQVLQVGKELVVKYSHIAKISKEVPKGMGKQMHAAFEAAAIQAGKEAGAKSVRVIVELVQNPAWKEYLSSIGYQWMSTAEGIGMTKFFPL